LALALASSLQPLWFGRGGGREGLAWFDAVLSEENTLDLNAEVRARALADQALLAAWVNAAASLDHAQQALAIARDINDPALLVRALTACCSIAVLNNPEVARPYFAEAIGLARALDDRWRLSRLLGWQALGAAAVAGNPIVARAAAEEGRDLADAIGDGWTSRQCRFCLGIAQLFQGDPDGAGAQFADLVAEAEAAHDVIRRAASLAYQGIALAHQGETGAARATADAAVEAASEVGEIHASVAYWALAIAALAASDAATVQDACEKSWQHLSLLPQTAAVARAYYAQAALAGGNLMAARRSADEAITSMTGWYSIGALTTRCRVAIAEGEPDQAERDAHDALAIAANMQAYLGVSDTLECLAALAGESGSHREAARLFGVAHSIRQRMGEVRFKVWDVGCDTSVAAVRDALGEKEFQSAWTEGAALSTDEAIAYAQRGRGQRKRPTSGWASLTPTERDVVRLVSDGLGNKDIATRLFVSPRTVQTHLTHVYSKLGVTSRVQLVQEAVRHP
jgi:DNA-binding CsgD family transcriptional regulator